MEIIILHKILINEDGTSIEDDIKNFLDKIENILNNNIERIKILYEVIECLTRKEKINLDRLNTLNSNITYITSKKYSKCVVKFLYYFIMAINSTEINYICRDLDKLFH